MYQMWPKSMNFIRRLNRENFYLSSLFFQFGGLLGVWKLALYAKFQLNISKIMPTRPKKHWNMGLNMTRSKANLYLMPVLGQS